MPNPAQFLPSAAYRRAGILVVRDHLVGAAPATAANYGTLFIAPYKCLVLRVEVVWGTLSTSGTLQLERLQGTEAKDGGDDLFTATVDMSATADTVTTPALTTTTANLELSAGDRLGLVNGGDLTNQADLTVVVELCPIP